jgi:DNA repair exonuclease SbcCD nuclease subunit
MKILHITDLHFGQEHYFNQSTDKDDTKFTLTDAISNCLTNVNITKIDFLIISGDIFNKNIENEMIQAKKELRKLIDRLNISDDNILIIPGNHDIDWTDKHNGNKYFLFNEFLDIIIKNNSLTKYPIIKHLNKDIAIIGINSCEYENEEYAGFGRIGEKQLELLSTENKENEKLRNAKFKIAVLHHHLLPVFNESQIINLNLDVKKAKLSTTVDSVNVLRNLSELNVNLVITGHQHQNSVIQYENIYEKKKPIIVLTLGSTGLKHSDSTKYRAFNVYSFEGENCDVISFKEHESEENYFVHNNSNNIRIPFERSGYADDIKKDYCNVIFSYRKIDTRFQTQYMKDDFSDLYIVFFSVVDCSKSREIIKENLNLLQEEYKLLSMYDLLGKYDLAIFIRFKKASNFHNLVIEKLREMLIKGGMMSESHEFSEIKYVNVYREAGKFEHLLHQGNQFYNKRILGTTENYEQYRIQKGLIYIEFENKNKVSIERVITQIGEIVEKNGYHEFIESVYQSNSPNRVIIIEFFTKCSEYFLINKFNRDIEECLTQSRLQKSTMLYYYYDESLSDQAQM